MRKLFIGLSVFALVLGGSAAGTVANAAPAEASPTQINGPWKCVQKPGYQLCKRWVNYNLAQEWFLGKRDGYQYKIVYPLMYT